MANEIDEVYQLRINLKDVSRPIWRTIEVPVGFSFWELHCAIQDAMGWSNTALHEFIMKESDDSIYIIAIPDDELVYEALNPRQEMIAEHFPDTGSQFEYMYDFDSGWEHEIKIESIKKAEPGKEYPLCIDGEGSCPPESVGGAWEYDHALQVIGNPTNEEYDEVVGMLGGDKFDPEDFSIDDIKFQDPENTWKKRF